MATRSLPRRPGVSPTEAEGRLESHHFVYLRAVSQGMAPVDAARRWLGIEQAAEARGAHRDLVERARAVARRRGDSRWRLLGIELRRGAGRGGEDAHPPSLEDWAQAEGISDFAERELLELYAERFGVSDASQRRRFGREERLREKRLSLLHELEQTATAAAHPADLLEGWLPLDLAEQLKRREILTLAHLQGLIRRGGRWWTGLRAFGPTKAARLAELVSSLLPGRPDAGWPVVLASHELKRLDGRSGENRAAQGSRRLVADNDRDAMRAWIAARAGSELTASRYEREAERFILFCVLECSMSMSDATAEHCRAYMDFLGAIPDRWISRKKVPRLAAGWAPFRDQLTPASQQVAIDILHGMFGWMVRAGYLASNPWELVNRRLGDEARAASGTADAADSASRALTPVAWSALLDWLDQQPATSSTARLRWLCLFEQAVGLRAAELLHATRGDLQPTREGWVIRVHGKGRRNRTVPVPSSAVKATSEYFSQRGLTFDEAAGNTPLLASLVDPGAPLTYASLQETFKRFVRRAVAASSLSPADRAQAARATTHWLRHTHATRAAEASVPLDVLQENLGHSDPRTTARYYRAQNVRRQREMERAFGE